MDKIHKLFFYSATIDVFLLFVCFLNRLQRLLDFYQGEDDNTSGGSSLKHIWQINNDTTAFYVVFWMLDKS